MQQTSEQELDKKNKVSENLGGNNVFKQMKKRIKNEKGLTLIELLAVIVILAIISAIAVPAIGNIIQNSRDKAVLSEALNIVSGAKIAHMDNKCSAPATDTGTVTCNKAALEKYVDGLELPSDLSVTLTNGEWSFSSATLQGEISADGNFSDLNNGAITEAVIKKSLEDGKYTAPTPPTT